MEAVDKAGHYRKISKETPKARKAKGTKITRLRTEERTRLRTEERNRQEERKRGRHIFGCLFGVPFILVVLVLFIFISKPMIPMCIIWIIGMLLEMALG